MEIKLILTELWPFKLSHFGQLLHYSVWSLCNHLLLQFSINQFQTLHTFCQYNVVALLFYVHSKHLRSCRDGQLT